MSTRIAFLRGVNLGKRTVSMARLKQTLEALGYEDVWTFVNSGNAVFDASGARAKIERDIEGALAAEFGFDVETFVRTPAELRTLTEEKPFPVVGDDTHFIAFLRTAPGAAQAKQLKALSGSYDTLVVHGQDVHWRMRGKSSDSPLKKKDWERILGPNSSTSRNMNMLRRLLAKIDARR
jgi:uncharacterized protein (DUF1697 family)